MRDSANCGWMRPRPDGRRPSEQRSERRGRPCPHDVRTVGLSAAGVALRYLHRRATLPWREIMKVDLVTDKVVVFRPLSRPTGLGEWYQISLEQARRILKDPSCPLVQLADAHRQTLFETRACS